MMFGLKLLRRQIRGVPWTTFAPPNRFKATFKDGGEQATFNDVPIPQGCWHEDHARKQNRYMKVLVTGIASFIGSVIFVATSDGMEFNFTVPDYPYEEEE